MARRLPSSDPMATAAALIGDNLVQALAGTEGRVGLMLSGGRSPAQMLSSLLARDEIDWARIDTVASDERVVPPDHQDSTEGLIRGAFDRAGRPLRYAGLQGRTDPQAALVVWRAGIAEMAWPPASAFLGMGDDAHTASLFPGRPEAADPSLRTASVPETAPHRHPRLTFGAAALAECASIVLGADTPGKRAALDQATSAGAGPGDFPVLWLTALDQCVIIVAPE